MPLITGNNTAQSYLWFKINGTQGTLDCSKGDDSMSCGLQMPYVGTPLTQSQLGTIEAWINEGAPNN